MGFVWEGGVRRIGGRRPIRVRRAALCSVEPAWCQQLQQEWGVRVGVSGRMSVVGMRVQCVVDARGGSVCVCVCACVCACVRVCVRACVRAVVCFG